MSAQAIRQVDGLFEPTQVLVDVLTELVADIDVLSLLVRRVLAAEFPRGMQLTAHAVARQKICIRYGGDNLLNGINTRVEFANLGFFLLEIVLDQGQVASAGLVVVTNDSGSCSGNHAVAVSRLLSRQRSVDAAVVRTVTQNLVARAVMHGCIVLGLKMPSGLGDLTSGKPGRRALVAARHLVVASCRETAGLGWNCNV